MARILVHEFISLDGVIDEPRWTFDFPFDPRMGTAIAGIMGSCRAILLGRRTYEMFAPAWSKRTAQEDPGAPFMNDSPKYVVSASPDTVDWDNSEIIGPYDADKIRALKEGIDGNIYVSGSGTLVRAMLADGLVDEVHLFIFPLTVGSGSRLFADAASAMRFNVKAAEVYENGVVYLPLSVDVAVPDASDRPR